MSLLSLMALRQVARKRGYLFKDGPIAGIEQMMPTPNHIEVTENLMLSDQKSYFPFNDTFKYYTSKTPMKGSDALEYVKSRNRRRGGHWVLHLTFDPAYEIR